MKYIFIYENNEYSSTNASYFLSHMQTTVLRRSSCVFPSWLQAKRAKINQEIGQEHWEGKEKEWEDKWREGSGQEGRRENFCWGIAESLNSSRHATPPKPQLIFKGSHAFLTAGSSPFASRSPLFALNRVFYSSQCKHGRCFPLTPRKVISGETLSHRMCRTIDYFCKLGLYCWEVYYRISQMWINIAGLSQSLSWNKIVKGIRHLRTISCPSMSTNMDFFLSRLFLIPFPYRWRMENNKWRL